MAAPLEIAELVERFEGNLDDYRSGRYKETQLRLEFIDPFFEALGWDVHNKRGYAEAYKDVIHEDAIKVGGATKAPDYCFRIGGTRKFFVEAKKPSVSIKDAVHPAYQLRRYAWSAKLPLSILTDFEEFAAYDCRIKPSGTDKASAARTLYVPFTEYPQRWDEIASIFSREEVLKGSFDKYAESTKRKKGTAEVDSAFLQEIEVWRDSLARNIALRNPQLSQRELNFAVQRTIDRIIFLRICEDRGVEHYGQLQALLNGTNVYPRLCQLFYRADERYNSGLFYFRKEKARPDAPDELTPGLAIDDGVLKDIITRLYYPESPYEFSVLPADILGQVYEQFLGKVIRLTAGHRAVVEDKPEVRKAGGVYYTPTYIVDYIVKNTVGKLLEGSGVRGQGSGKGATSNGDSNVPGFGSVAEGHGPGRGSLSANEAVSTNGTIGSDESNATSRGFDSSEHSRGARSAPPRGLPSVPFHSEGIPDGSGDSPADCGEAGLSGTGSGQGGLDSVAGCWTAAQRTDSVTGHQKAGGENQDAWSGPGSPCRGLTPDPRPLTPKDVSKLRILDPACGSGSFLIGAYQYLLDWHLNWYTTHNPEKWARKKTPPIYQTPGPRSLAPDPRPLTPGYRLTTSERKRILLNNIYGVDIDPQAVEVTKLSLLLKVLEGENEETLERQLKFFHERALPDLGSNIKCGNSLIGPDFYDNQQMTFLDEEERYRINAFDWNAEFPEIMKSGGFDAVIGNPPYVRQEGLGEAKTYYQSHYHTFRPTADLYVNFIERGLGLIREGGLFGMIVSNKWLRAAYGRPLREFLTSRARLLDIIDLAGLPVFPGATVRTIILVCSAKGVPGQSVRYVPPPPPDDFATIHSGERLQELANRAAVAVPLSRLSPEGWSLAAYDAQRILSRINGVSIPLKQYIQGTPLMGVKTGLNKAFIIDRPSRDSLIAKDPKSAEIIKPLLSGRDVRRYAVEFKERYLIWTYVGVPIKAYPAISEHLTRFRSALQVRWDKGNFWWELRPCDYYDRFQKAKIIYPDISTRCRFALDRDGYFASNTTYFIPADDPYLLGILNSKMGQFYFSQVCAGLEGGGGTYLRFFGQYLEGFPVRPINSSDPADKARHDRMVELVDRMLELHKKLAAAKTAHEKTVLQREIETSDRQIDQLVYDLYGLTEEEIEIVEEASSR